MKKEANIIFSYSHQRLVGKYILEIVLDKGCTTKYLLRPGIDPLFLTKLPFKKSKIIMKKSNDVIFYFIRKEFLNFLKILKNITKTYDD